MPLTSPKFFRSLLAIFLGHHLDPIYTDLPKPRGDLLRCLTAVLLLQDKQIFDAAVTSLNKMQHPTICHPTRFLCRRVTSQVTAQTHAGSWIASFDLLPEYEKFEGERNLRVCTSARMLFCYQDPNDSAHKAASAGRLRNTGDWIIAPQRPSQRPPDALVFAEPKASSIRCSAAKALHSGAAH